MKRRLHRPRKRDIPLELLSAVWRTEEIGGTGQHHEHESIQEGHRSSHSFALNQWSHGDINSFCAQYIRPYLPSLGRALPVIERILGMLDEQGDCPSSLSVKGEAASPDFVEEGILAGLTLREYSLHVARITHDLIKKGHKETMMGKFLILALGHKLGILSGADMLGGVSVKSVLMLDPLLQDLPYRDDIMVAIRMYQDNRPKTDAARILKGASAAAGKAMSERAKVLSKACRRPSVDIEKISAAIHSPQTFEDQI